MLPYATGVTLLVAGTVGVAFYHLRHFGLLVLVLLAPMPGLAAAAFVTPHWTIAGAIYAALAYLTGLSAGLVLAGDVALLVCDGADAKSAIHVALRMRLPGMSSGVAAVLVAALVLSLLQNGDARALTGAGLVTAASLSTVASIYLAGVLTYGEDFVTRRNRARERWNRIFDLLIAVARPRWGFSVAGIALVFAVLGFFGAQKLEISADVSAKASVVFLSMVLVALAAMSVVIRDWRTILSTAVALCLPVLTGLWGLARLALPLDVANLLLLSLALGIGAVPLATAGAEAGRHGRSGDDATIAAARTLLRSGPGLFFAAAVPTLALILSVPLMGEVGFMLAAVAAFAGAGPLLFQPAFGIVIETWFPRTSTIATRYRLS